MVLKVDGSLDGVIDGVTVLVSLDTRTVTPSPPRLHMAYLYSLPSDICLISILLTLELTTNYVLFQHDLPDRNLTLI